MLRGRERARGIRLVMLLVPCALTTGVVGCKSPLPFPSGGEFDGEEPGAPSEGLLEEDFVIVPLETRLDDPDSLIFPHRRARPAGRSDGFLANSAGC